MAKRTFQRALKWTAVSLFGAVAVLQFIRPARTNPPVDQARTIQALAHVTPEVAGILDRSCNDCHTNQTRWPWYSQIAPVSWKVAGDVNEGRDHMNLSDWAQYSRSEQESLLRHICREVKDGTMPLRSYLWMHADAKLSTEDVKTLCDWASKQVQN
ncbi:MAG: heme-binding domain-containing protein [Acidobacteriota bacterium]|nr:heme-binding domain-containing protein [Acidobacteriota bacterium]